MRQLFSKLLAVALLLVACSGAVWGNNLTVTITESNGTRNTKTGQESMEKALEGYFLQGIIGIEVSAGNFETDDWIWLQSHTWYLGRLEKFEVTGGIGNVANIPNTTWWDGSYFSIALKELHVAKLKRVGNEAFSHCYVLTSVSLPAATKIGSLAFNACSNLPSVSLPAAKEIEFWAFKDCPKLTSLQLGATPPSVNYYAFEGCPNSRTLIITDAAGVPLVGTELESAAAQYDRQEGAPNDRRWYGWDIQYVSIMGSVEIHPSDGGTVSITRKDGGAVVSPGDVLKKGAVLVVEGKPVDGYWVKAITAVGAKKIGDNEWQVTAKSGEVIFTVEFEKLATLGATIKTPTDAGELTITRKDGGSVVSPGDVLKEGAVLVVEGKPVDGYRVKAITAVGANRIGEGNEWEVTAKTGEVIFTVEFGAIGILGATSINPEEGTVTITRKAGGAVVKEGDALTKDEVLVIDAKPKDKKKYQLKEVTAKGADKAGKNEWKVNVAAPGEQVVFTVVFEKAITLGATSINPEEGTVTITHKKGGAVVNVGDALTKDEVLVIDVKPKDKKKYQLKEVTAKGADKAGKNEWKVTAAPGEQVVFTVKFEKAQEVNNNNDPTPVESVLLSQVQLSPNPTDGQVTVDAGTAIARCEVYTNTGALLQTIEAPESMFTIDLTASPSGVYLVRLVDMQGGCKTLRVVKQ